jgi:hypothetical protein
MTYLTLCMDRTVGVFDEGLILLGATRVLDGAVPHRDFYTLYGPGQFYALAALFKLFGVSVLVERAWDAAVRACSVVLVFIIVGQVASRRVATLTAIACLGCLGSFGSFGYPVFPALAAALLGLAFLAPALGQVGAPSGLAAAGVCAGVTTLFRYDVGLAAFAAQCAVLAFATWIQPSDQAHGRRTAVRNMTLFGLGFAVVVAPVAAAFALCGALPDLVFDVVVYPVRFYAKMRSLPFPRPSQLPAEPAAFAVYLPPMLCALAVPSIVAIARARRDSGTVGDGGDARSDASAILPITLIGLCVLTLVFFAKGVVRVSTLHMAMALITSLALAGVLAQPLPGRGPIGRTMVAAAVLASSAFAISNVRTGLQIAAQNIAWARDPASWTSTTGMVVPEAGSCRMPPGLERLACFRTSPAMIETIRYIQRRTAADAPVFIGLPRHDRIFVSDVLLYFAMNRAPATKWYEFDPGLQTSAPIQQAMVSELQRTRPCLIVLDSSWVDAREPNDSALSSGVTVLDDYLRHAYEPVATFGPNTIMRARRSDRDATVGAGR